MRAPPAEFAEGRRSPPNSGVPSDGPCTARSPRPQSMRRRQAPRDSVRATCDHSKPELTLLQFTAAPVTVLAENLNGVVQA